jgi:hypothetical protein
MNRISAKFPVLTLYLLRKFTFIEQIMLTCIQTIGVTGLLLWVLTDTVGRDFNVLQYYIG